MKTLPPINLRYWTFVIALTTLGETAGDLISQTLGLGYGGGTLFIVGLFFLAVGIAVASRKQHESVYWIALTLASIGGTTLSDFVSRSLEQGYAISTGIIAGALVVVLVLWKLSARTMDLKGAISRRTEVLYWLAILSSSTLGTAFGDLISNGTSLGFAGGTLLLLGLLAALVVAVLFTKIPRAVCYWLGIIITHPLGATMGDFMTKDEGLNLGNWLATGILVGVILLIIAVDVTLRRKAPAQPPPPQGPNS